MTSVRLLGFMSVALCAMPVWAQSPPPVQTPAQTKPAQTRPAQTRRVERVPTQIVVRDMSGSPLSDVTVAISGAARSTATTDAQGVAPVTLADGSYRLRFEHEGFIVLERDVTIRNGRPNEIAVGLNRAPAPPEPVPAPAPPPATPAAVATAGRDFPPANVSITAFLNDNFVGRAPLKESILGCLQDATARLLQIREPLGRHTHDDVDEVLYVVAGEGTLRIGQEATEMTPGFLSTIPRGTPHNLERRGRNPLILLSTLAGAPCPASAVPPNGR